MDNNKNIILITNTTYYGNKVVRVGKHLSPVMLTCSKALLITYNKKIILSVIQCKLLLFQ